MERERETDRETEIETETDREFSAFYCCSVWFCVCAVERISCIWLHKSATSWETETNWRLPTCDASTWNLPTNNRWETCFNNQLAWAGVARWPRGWVLSGLEINRSQVQISSCPIVECNPGQAVTLHYITDF